MTHREEMGDLNVTIVLGEYETVLDIEDIDFCVDAEGKKYVHILPKENQCMIYGKTLKKEHFQDKVVFQTIASSVRKHICMEVNMTTGVTTYKVTWPHTSYEHNYLSHQLTFNNLESAIHCFNQAKE